MIHELSLHQYRNFDAINLTIHSNHIVILGDNGSGKTNILEAISLFSPGRGLRGAKLEEVCNNKYDHFKTQIILENTLGKARISSTYDKLLSKRIISFNDEKINHHELASLCKIIWLTPQMEGIFLGPSSDRRKFFDRIVFAFNAQYAKIIGEYEYYLKERSKLLQMPSIDHKWLQILEDKLGGSALAIVTERVKVLDILQRTLNELETPFPKALLSFDPSYHDMDAQQFQSGFEKSRDVDKHSKRNNFGPHRMDLVVRYAEKDAHAKYSSTGEQKAILISILLGQIFAIKKYSNEKSIVLLDETFVHLDDLRRQYLTNILQSINAQIWITSTEPEFHKYFSEGQVIRLT